jgi:Holliday junction resolvase RusA-like endonuclease
MKTSLRLTEAKQHMTKLEKQLHKKLIKLLLDDGKGHHHKKYAMRLKDFNIKVVSLKADPKMTAAISFDLGVIYISEGFLLDESLFFQLNVLMRHELAHNLLMHQIRMMRQFGEDFNLKWGNSMTLHGFLNYIEDLEISDRIYSKEDKDVVRKMFLNGRTIGGLITDDIRPEWVDLPVEQMYHRLQAEIDAIHNEIANGIKSAVAHHSNPDDDLTPRIKASMDMYSDIDRTSEIEELLADMAAKGFKFNGQSLPPDFYNIIKSIYDAFTETPINDKQVDSVLLTIKKSNPTHTTPVIHPVTSKKIVDLHTPEHKGFAVEVIKKFRSEEEDWYRTVYITLKEFGYDSATIKDIWDKTRGAGNGN